MARLESKRNERVGVGRFQNWRGLPLHWILPLLFFCVGLLYLYAAPHFEASDNIPHVGVVKWIAERGALPVQSAEHDHLYGQEASQPPLYYLLMAPIWALADTSDFDEMFQLNPFVLIGHPKRLGNRNLVLYRQPYPPDLRGSSLALYAIRLVTLCMATATVAAVHQSARTILPESAGFALLAFSLAAFNPMFLFISTSVSNDNLVSMFAALACWGGLRMLRDGFDARRSVALSIAVALAGLSKLGGLVMAPALALAGLWLWRRGGDRRGFFILLGSLAIALLLLLGWWILRNLQLYGELFGTSAMLDFFGRRSVSLSQLLLEEFQGLRISFWGLFGAFSILTHDLFYQLMDALCLLGAGGLLLHAWGCRRRPFQLAVLGYLGFLLAVGGAMLIWWTMQTTASTGRLLFPYISSIALLLALGLRALRIPPLLISAPLFAFAVAAPFLYIIPNYQHPPQLEALPASARPADAQWDDIRLVGHQLPPPQRYAPGDHIPLSLYWQPQAQSSERLALFLTVIDADGQAIATIDSFPGWGSLPTTWWQPGAIYRDDYILQLPEDAAGYSSARLHIGWYAYPDGSDIRPELAAGGATDSYILPLGAFVDGASRELAGEGLIADGTVFGDAIQLNAYRFGDGSLLELEWRLLREMAGDWRVFAMVFSEPYQAGAAFEILLQHDAAPAVALEHLRPGETFQTRHLFPLPAGFSGEHGVYVGWYNDDLVQRLAAPYPSNMLELPGLRFGAPADETQS